MMQVQICLDREGGYSMGAAFEHFLCHHFVDHKIWPQTAVFLNAERDMLSDLNNFPVPRVGNLTKKMPKN